MRWLGLVLLGGCQCGGPSGVDAGFDERALTRLMARFGTAAHANDQVLVLRQLRAALRDGRVALDPVVLERCLLAAEPVAVFEEGSLSEPCRGLWVPRTPVGGACESSQVCIGGFCEREASGLCGVCRSGSVAGAACRSDLQCLESLRCLDFGCDGGDCIGRCRLPGLEGAPCPCADGLNCIGDRCARPARLGEPCGAAGCLEGVCLSSGRCGAPASCMRSRECGAGGVCVVEDVDGGLLLARQGAGRCVTTSLGSPCEASCGAGLVCVARFWRSECVASVRVGDACEFDAQCPPGADCAEGRCRARRGPGEPCGDDGACMAGTGCVEGRCSRVPRAFEPCQRSCNGAVCRSGRCEGETTEGTVCLGALDACGGGRRCESNRCTSAAARDPSCERAQCEGGLTCDGRTCRPTCGLGDGLARGDFSGGWEPRRPAAPPCVPTGPADLVIPLTERQARCVFGEQPTCVGCHSVSGCPEVRPRFGPAPPQGHPTFDFRFCLDGG